MDKEFKDLMEKKYEELKGAKWHDAPFPMDEYEANIWHRGRLELMQWVLEMMPSEENDHVDE